MMLLVGITTRFWSSDQDYNKQWSYLKLSWQQLDQQVEPLINKVRSESNSCTEHVIVPFMSIVVQQSQWHLCLVCVSLNYIVFLWMFKMIKNFDMPQHRKWDAIIWFRHPRNMQLSNIHYQISDVYGNVWIISKTTVLQNFDKGRCV